MAERLVPPIAELSTASTAPAKKPESGDSTSQRRIEGDDPRIARAVAGERDAAASLLGELLPRTRNLVRFLLRNDADVDDVAQNALVEVLRSLPSFRGQSALTTWADRITARCALRHAGRRKRARDQQREAAAELTLLHLPATTRSSGDTYAARRELARVLSGLPDAQREALVLHHVAGLSVPEVAQEIGVSFDTAKSRLRLGMERLRRHYLPASETSQD
jgi:RNA polymerase sigma-70 factor (ECF subfamily)